MSCLWLTITQSMYGIVFFAPLMIKHMFGGGQDTTENQENSLANGNPAAEWRSPPYPEPASTGCGGESTAHDSGALVALLSIIPFAAAAVAMVVNAKLAEAANERHLHAGVPPCLGAIAMALTPLALRFVSPIAAFVCLVLAAAFVWALHGPFMSWPATFLEGYEASAGFAFMNSLGSLGGMLGPLLLGVLVDEGGDYMLAMFVLSGMLALGGLGILLFPVGIKNGIEDQVLPWDVGNALDMGNKEMHGENSPILQAGRMSVH